MRRLRQDLDWIVSAGLLLSVAATAATGVIADLWDLNDFWYHTVSGYVMGGLAIAHILFNWERLVGYARFRLRRADRPVDRGMRRPAAAPAQSSAGDPGPAASPAVMLKRVAISRRGLLGVAASGLAGWVIGRGLRPPPQLAAGSDVGVVYHEWSKPGLIDPLARWPTGASSRSSTRRTPARRGWPFPSPRRPTDW